MAGIRVSGLTKRFGQIVAIRDVSFEVPEGSVATLLGPSGCGKSTTLRLIAGLDRSDEGSIWIGDRMVSSNGTFVPPQRRQIGFVFQAYALWPNMTAFDQVAYPLRARGVSHDDVRQGVSQVLEMVGLSREVDRYPSELSGGQQQRVALARALVFQPCVLLLDEPLSNLDAELRTQLRAELHQLHRRIQVTSIHVTHDQQEALSLSDLVVVMSSGRVIEVGTPDDVYNRPKNSLTASLVGSSNSLKGVITHITADGRAQLELAGGGRMTGLAQSPVQPGETGRIVFRPEDGVVSASIIGRKQNHLEGTVTGRMYFGSYALLTVRLEGSEVRIHIPKSNEVKPGDVVSVAVDVERVMVFSAAINPLVQP